MREKFTCLSSAEVGENHNLRGAGTAFYSNRILHSIKGVNIRTSPSVFEPCDGAEAQVLPVPVSVVCAMEVT